MAKHSAHSPRFWIFCFGSGHVAILVGVICFELAEGGTLSEVVANLLAGSCGTYAATMGGLMIKKIGLDEALEHEVDWSWGIYWLVGTPAFILVLMGSLCS